jgi:ABC-type molybdate transport system substrate-binding protein
MTINLTSGTSRQLADRILKGDTCDVFAPSSPKIADELVEKGAAPWSVVFSANEMVVIAAKGNPKNIHKIADLVQSGVTFTRITGDKDLGTGRTVEFLKHAAALEGKHRRLGAGGRGQPAIGSCDRREGARWQGQRRRGVLFRRRRRTK